MGKPIPTLTEDGFVTEPNVKLLKVFAYFIASLASESTTYGNITSLSNIIAQHSTDNQTAIANSIEEGLNTLYSNYFDNTDISCDVNTSGGYIFIKMNISVVENNITYTLAKTIKATKSGDILDYENELDKFYRYYVGEGY